MRERQQQELLLPHLFFLSKFEGGGGAGLLDLQASFGETSRAAAQNTVITSREVGNGEQSG